MSNNPPLILDLFCGCGGMSTGFVQAGYKVVAALDVWDKATETYRANHHDDTRVLTGDIINIHASDLIEEGETIDIVVGGPPCQGFSMAGRRDNKDPRNSLFIQFIRIVDTVRPRFVLMENVPGILSMKTDDGTFVKDIILEEYKRIGYNVTYKILNAAEYGVPQSRKRVFFFGHRIDNETLLNLTFPTTTNAQVPVSSILLPRSEIPTNAFLSERALAGIQRKKEASRAKGNGFGAQIMDLTKPSYTITARYWKDGYDALVKYEDEAVRRLVPAELARIQSFPTDYDFKGTKKDIIMQIGNAVPCGLAYNIAKHIRETYINDIVSDMDKLSVTDVV